jgi:hypothetical protein
VHEIHTLEDVIHAVMNSLCLISSQSQYLLGKHDEAANGKASELEVIWDEAVRAAQLLNLVPEGLARTPIDDGEIETRATDEVCIRTGSFVDGTRPDQGRGIRRRDQGENVDGKPQP